MVKYGVVCEVKPGYAKVNFQEDDIVTDWLQVLAKRSKGDKESWQLEINEQVACLMDAHCEDGIILGALPNEVDGVDEGQAAGKFRKVFSDGTIIEYDSTAHKLTVDVKGDISAKATGGAVIDISATLEAKAGVKASITAPEIECTASATAKITAPVITLQGNVIVSGTLAAAGALTAASIATTGGGSIASQGNMTVQGTISATGDVTGGGKSLATHTHTAPSGGGPTSPPL